MSAAAARLSFAGGTLALVIDPPPAAGFERLRWRLGQLTAPS